MGLPSKELEEYLGSQQSAVGLLLVWFGFFSLGVGILAISVDDFQTYVGPILLGWGGVAVPTGLWLRRARPTGWRWALCNIWLGIALLSGIGVTFLR